MARPGRTSTRRRTGALVLVSSALWWSVLAPAAAHASPPAHAGAPQATHGGEHTAADRDGRQGPPASKARGREHAPGQATTPGRSGDAPGRQPATAQPPADPGPTNPAPPAPAKPAPPAPTEPAPTKPAPTKPAPTKPAPAAPSDPAPSAPAPSTPAASRPPTPATAAPAGAASDAANPAPTDRTPPVVRGETTAEEPATAAAPSPPRPSVTLLRSTVEAASGTAERLRSDLTGSVGDVATAAARKLTPNVFTASVPDVPLPARDLGLPMGLLAVLGAYLAVSRLLDRGGLPMTITDGQEDDVQHVL